MTIRARLVRLEDRRRKQPSPPALVDFDERRLTDAERADLAEIRAAMEPVGAVGNRFRRWDSALEPLTCDQLDRLESLTRKATGVPPKAPPSYPYADLIERSPCADCRPGCTRWRALDQRAARTEANQR